MDLHDHIQPEDADHRTDRHRPVVRTRGDCGRGRRDLSGERRLRSAHRSHKYDEHCDPFVGESRGYEPAAPSRAGWRPAALFIRGGGSKKKDPAGEGRVLSFCGICAADAVDGCGNV